MPNNFKILVCEDDKHHIRNIKLYLNSLKEDLSKKVHLTYKIVFFKQVYDELKNEYHLMILDLYDQKSKDALGENVLMHNKNQIPTIIYTGQGDRNEFDVSENKKKYKFLLHKLTKLKDGVELKQKIKDYLFESHKIEKSYSLYSDEDQLLKYLVDSFGETYFNEILFEIKNSEKSIKEIIVYNMTLGLSGALLFKLKIDGDYAILKISKELKKLEVEHDNAMNLYAKFPNTLVNHINPQKVYSRDGSALGILIKEVEDSETLFDFVTNSETSTQDITDVLVKLFEGNQGLANHYAKHKRDKGDWRHIFNKIDTPKLIQVEKSYSELKILLNKYYRDFDLKDFESAAIDYKFGKLHKSKFLDEKYKKNLVLLHGDMHSKNILIQNPNNPILIDTGSIGYEHWSIDICKLIVHFFTDGLDYNNIERFNVNRVPHYINALDSLLKFQNIHPDGVNDNIYHVINWLKDNVEKIFPKKFKKFEFQLGLMREFLQKSYRFATITNAKRAFAMIAAHKCLIASEENAPE